VYFKPRLSSTFGTLMLKRYLVLSVMCGIFISVFSNLSNSSVGLLLRVPGYYLREYFPVFVSLQIGNTTIAVSISDVAIYSLVALVLYWLISSASRRLHLYGNRSGLRDTST